MDSRLIPFREAVRSFGHDVRYVGGCVRDTLAGQTPKDIDLATDMTPDEQQHVYETLGLRHIPTGSRFGTFTVVIDDVPYEVTSLRSEADFDGRHATMTFTKDWIADLSRRDLTINAISMTFDGEIVDPFAGADDLRRGRVRFVGSAIDRMQEDYLRILRWFRFHGRFGAGELDEETYRAVEHCAPGLLRISSERVWMEMAKIVVGPQSAAMIDAIQRSGVAQAIGFACAPDAAQRLATTQAVTSVGRIVAALPDRPQAVYDLAEDWKWSAAEREFGAYLARNAARDVDYKREIAVSGVDLAWVQELARLQGRAGDVPSLDEWVVPEFPVRGKDLLDKGMKPGPQIGSILTELKDLWATSGYKLSKQSLLDVADRR